MLFARARVFQFNGIDPNRIYNDLYDLVSDVSLDDNEMLLIQRVRDKKELLSQKKIMVIISDSPNSHTGIDGSEQEIIDDSD